MNFNNQGNSGMNWVKYFHDGDYTGLMFIKFFTGEDGLEFYDVSQFLVGLQGQNIADSKMIVLKNTDLSYPDSVKNNRYGFPMPLH